MKLAKITFLALGSLIFHPVYAMEKSGSPNLIIILTDDQGYADAGFNGCRDIPTPNMDRIAGQGVVFTNGYASFCVCGPSRAGLITGRYQDRFGFARNPLFAPNDPEMGLPLSEETLADALKKANYKSVAIGKWHLGAHESLHPLNRGFDDFFGFLGGAHHYFPELITLNDPYEAKDEQNTRLLRNFERVDETEYLTDALSREAVSYIKKYKNEPFFIYLAYNAPHTPLQATEKYLSRFGHIKDKRRKTYAAMLSAVDDGVGMVLSTLKELNLEENTIVVFLSDNGGPENDNGSDNGILRGQKSELFEGGIRVPFAMSWPASIPAGMVYHNPVISLDIFATVIAQVKTPVITKNPLDGVNLIPFLSGEKRGSPHDVLFWRRFGPQEYPMEYAVRKGNEKLIVRSDKMFFNLEQDISEQNNIISIQINQFDKLFKVFKNWELAMQKPKFKGLLQKDEYDAENPDRFKRPE